MFTFNEFASEWQRLHHPSMDVTGDVAFFYEIYVRLHRLVDKKRRRSMNSLFFLYCSIRKTR